MRSRGIFFISLLFTLPVAYLFRLPDWATVLLALALSVAVAFVLAMPRGGRLIVAGLLGVGVIGWIVQTNNIRVPDWSQALVTPTPTRPPRTPTPTKAERIANDLRDMIRYSGPSSIFTKYENQLEVATGPGELVVYFWGDADNAEELTHLAATSLLNSAVLSHRGGDYFERVVFTRPYNDGSAITFWIEGGEAINAVADNHDSIWNYLRANIDWKHR